MERAIHVWIESHDDDPKAAILALCRAYGRMAGEHGAVLDELFDAATDMAPEYQQRAAA